MADIAPEEQTMGRQDLGDINVRPLTRDDIKPSSKLLQQISALHKEAMSDVKPCCCCIRQSLGEISTTFQKGLAESTDSKLESFGCAVDAKGDLVGYSMLGFHDTTGDVTMRDVRFLQEIPPQGTCHLEQIAVSDKARGKGVGKKLLIWADAKARERGCSRMKLEVISRNANAKGIYERGGYVQQNTCLSQCCMCPLLCCLMRVPYTYSMVKQLTDPDSGSEIVGT